MASDGSFNHAVHARSLAGRLTLASRWQLGMSTVAIRPSRSLSNSDRLRFWQVAAKPAVLTIGLLNRQVYELPTIQQLDLIICR